MALKPVGKFQIRGIGPVVTERLNEKGIYTIPDADRYVGENGLCGLMEVMKVGPMRSKKVLRHLRHGGGLCPRCMVRVNTRQLEKAYDATVDGRECPLLRDYTKGGLPIMKPDEVPVLLEHPVSPPFRYQGGKFIARRKILGLAPPHKVFVESFAGAGNVLLAKPPSEVEVLNDKDPRIMNVHRGLKKEKAVWHMTPQRKKWEEIRHKAPEERTPEEQAYLIEFSYGGKVNERRANYHASGRNGDLDTGALHDRLRDVIMVNDDFATVMKKWDSEETLHYLDPIYNDGKSNVSNYNEASVTPADVAMVANKMKGKVMVSYPDSPPVRAAFSGRKWRKQHIEVIRSMQTAGKSHGGQKLGKYRERELLLTNFDPSRIREGHPEYVETRIAEGMKGLFG